MRASERNAFLRECEQSRNDLQAIHSEIAQEEQVASHLHTIAFEILSHFGLEVHVERFLGSADGLALLANCCNYAAKRYDRGLYEYKSELIVHAMQHPDTDAWQKGENIIYIETSIGQVSFHVFADEDDEAIYRADREWSEIESQFNALLVAKAWLHGWSKDALEQTILLQMQKEREESEETDLAV